MGDPFICELVAGEMTTKVKTMQKRNPAKICLPGAAQQRTAQHSASGQQFPVDFETQIN
jgi:hypothetical protein